MGTVVPGKTQNKKNLTDIIAAHNVPYVAQTTFIGNFRDLYTKAQKAIYTPGPSFLNIMAPCPRGWEYPAEKLPEICKLAVETCVWPLFEVIDGVWHLSYEPKNKRPVEEYLRLQGRFRHMFKPGNEWMIEAAQKKRGRKLGEAPGQVPGVIPPHRHRTGKPLGRSQGLSLYLAGGAGGSVIDRWFR